MLLSYFKDAVLSDGQVDSFVRRISVMKGKWESWWRNSCGLVGSIKRSSLGGKEKTHLIVKISFS
jgi:hypothetical protein